MTLENLTQTIQNKVGEDSGLGASIKFAFNEGGIIVIDGNQIPNEITNEDRETQCTVRMAQGDFEAMLKGDLDATVAFMSGKLKVEGDMGVAMKLGSLVR